jgi:hypothetical protein
MPANVVNNERFWLRITRPEAPSHGGEMIFLGGATRIVGYSVPQALNPNYWQAEL